MVGHVEALRSPQNLKNLAMNLILGQLRIQLEILKALNEIYLYC